jgi:hypothetical protein
MERVAILGAGPIGLDAGLAFTEAGWEVSVLEAGPVGAHVRAWGHVPMFTPWSMNASERMRRHVVGIPDGEGLPTGDAFADVLIDPVAASLGDVVRTGVTVRGVGRRGLLKHEAIGDPERASRPFSLLLAAAGTEWSETADLVLDCTGTYGTPNALGDGGLPAPGEGTVSADRIVRHLPGPAVADGWAGQRVLLVGAGKSAQTAARDLADAGVAVLWAVRDPDPDWGAIPGDSLPERQALVEESERMRAGAVPGVEVRTGTHVAGLQGHDDGVGVTLLGPAGTDDVVVDRVLALTGYVGDASLYRQLQVHECYATGAPMNLAAALLAASGDGPADCLAQPAQGVDVLRSPEPDFFVLGAKSYGRSSAFLLRVGYQQVDEVVGAYTAVPAPASVGP